MWEDLRRYTCLKKNFLKSDSLAKLYLNGGKISKRIFTDTKLWGFVLHQSATMSAPAETFTLTDPELPLLLQNSELVGPVV